MSTAGEHLTLHIAHDEGFHIDSSTRAGCDGSAHAIRIVITACAGLFTAAATALTVVLGLAVEGVEIGLASYCFRCVATIIHQLTVDNDLVADLDVSIACLELLVAQIKDAEAVEFAALFSIFRDIEGCVAIGAAFGEGAFVSDAGNLAFHIDIASGIVGVVVRPSEIFHRCGCTCRVIRVIERTAALGFTGVSTAAATTTFALTIERVEEGLASHCLRCVVAIIHQLAAHDDLVADLDVSIARCKLLVAQIKDTVAVEFTTLFSVFRDVEGCIAIGAAFSEGAFVSDAGDLAFYIDIASDLVVVVARPVELACSSICTCWIIRVIERAATLGFTSVTTAATSASGLAVEGVDIGFVLVCLKCSIVVGHDTADDDLVTHLNLFVAFCPFLVAQIHSAVDEECVFLIPVIRDAESTVSKLAAELFPDRGDLAFDVDVRRTFLSAFQRLCVGDGCSHVVGVSHGAAACRIDDLGRFVIALCGDVEWCGHILTARECHGCRSQDE